MFGKSAILYCWFPTFFTAVAGVLANLAGGRITQGGASALLILVTVLIALSAVSAFVAHFRPEISGRLAWGAIVLNGLLVIFYFAGLHQGAEILCTSLVCTEDTSDRWSDALYFSIVTFTTLGYGDFQPVPEMRLLAGLQALIGYIYLGLTVGSLIDLGSNRS